MAKLALLGGEPIRKNPYPEWPVHDERDIEAVTGWLSLGIGAGILIQDRKPGVS